jgi:hypothetical protein
MTLPTRLAAALALILAAGPAPPPQKDQAIFDLTLRGIRAGMLTISGATDGGSYAAAGTLKTTGIVGALRKIRYDARAAGRLAKGRFTPARYEEKADTGKRQSEAVMEYRAGVPQVKVYNPPRAPEAHDLDPAAMGGTVDPLTALFATIRDVPADQACRLSIDMFDGRRQSRLVLAAPKTDGDGIVCAGEYRRVAGFSPDDMAEKARFPFRLTYAPAENGLMRVVEISMDTLYGQGRLKRR